MGMNSSNLPVNVVATLQARPEQAAALAAVLAELARTSQEEPGNRRFEVHVQADDASRLVCIEQWDSAAAADAHMAGPHVAAALGKLGEILAGPPQIVRYAQVA